MASNVLKDQEALCERNTWYTADVQSISGSVSSASNVDRLSTNKHLEKNCNLVSNSHVDRLVEEIMMFREEDSLATAHLCEL